MHDPTSVHNLHHCEQPAVESLYKPQAMHASISVFLSSGRRCCTLTVAFNLKLTVYGHKQTNIHTCLAMHPLVWGSLRLVPIIGIVWEFIGILQDFRTPAIDQSYWSIYDLIS